MKLTNMDHQIIDCLMDGPGTIAEISIAIRKKAESARHSFRKLEELGLIKVVDRMSMPNYKANVYDVARTSARTAHQA